jgi:hypothetical protein
MLYITKITKLQAEIDRGTTRFAFLLSRWLDLTNAIGEGAEKLEPAVKLLERVFKLFGSAKLDLDQGRLPAPEEMKRLPSPTTDGPTIRTRNWRSDVIARRSRPPAAGPNEQPLHHVDCRSGKGLYKIPMV